MEKKPIELYFHIPFCVKKCLYCDFYSGVFSDAAIETYFETVIEEMRDCPYSGKALEVSSIFFGGGTPSSVAPRFLGTLMNEARNHFSVLPDCEITVECNPGTVTEETLHEYRSFGVNRLSFGLQSSDDRLLQKIGRIHTYETFLSSYGLARKTGFQNVNVDLMAGLPGDTPENFEKTLKSVASLKPEHLSVYSLIIEENTPFYALYESSGTKRDELPDEEAERKMIRSAEHILSDAGYEQYEISNYALPGYECRHNVGYWTHVPYLGFGAAASSFVDGRRFRNASSLDYLSLPYEETETLSETDLMNEWLMLGFRMERGVSDRAFRARFSGSIRDFKGKEIEELLRKGLIVAEAEESLASALDAKKTPEERCSSGENGPFETFRLTERGKDLANLVFQAFL